MVITNGFNWTEDKQGGRRTVLLQHLPISHAQFREIGSTASQLVAQALETRSMSHQLELMSAV